jgi:uncharacterized UBP type Zn finger protein
MNQGCEHIDNLRDKIDPPIIQECEKCKSEGINWIALRMCLTCGHIGCCDSSTGLHARRHFEESKHPVMIEVPNKSWRWCYEHKQYG